ncbi:MAG: response regulator transcription factor [Ignavibacteria bacterium]|nr:response regulator transcription factor [Ignavibacteria bacterium]
MNAQVPVVRVLIADNNPDFLSALAQYVRSIPGVELVGEAVDGEDAIKKAEATYPDLIILDIIMPKKSGIEALSAIKDKFPDVTVVMISINEGQSYRKLAEVYRVDKYIGKNSDDIHKELLEVIQATQQKLASKNG